MVVVRVTGGLGVLLVLETHNSAWGLWLEHSNTVLKKGLEFSEVEFCCLLKIPLCVCVQITISRSKLSLQKRTGLDLFLILLHFLCRKNKHWKRGNILNLNSVLQISSRTFLLNVFIKSFLYINACSVMFVHICVCVKEKIPFTFYVFPWNSIESRAFFLLALKQVIERASHSWFKASQNESALVLFRHNVFQSLN